MARSFNGTSDYIVPSGAAVNAVPITLACWFNAAGVSGIHGLFTLNNTGGVNSDELSLYVTGANLVAECYKNGGSTGSATSSTTFAANAWNHAAGVFSAPNSRTVYLNGGGAATNTTSVTPTLSVVNFGRFASSAFFDYFAGSLAELGMWTAALTAQEIAALAAGATPNTVRPGSLVGYWPLWGLVSPEPDLSGNANNGTLTGTAAANHAPVNLFLPNTVYQPYPQVAATGANQQLLLMGVG